MQPRKIKFHSLLLVCICAFLCLHSLAQSSTIILTGQYKPIVVNNASFLKDSSCAVDFARVSSAGFDQKFQSVQKSNALQSDVHCYWIKFQIKNNSGKYGEWLLEFNKWKMVDFFISDSSNHFIKKVTGHVVPFNQRDFPLANKNLISVHLNADRSAVCYVKLEDGNDFFIAPVDLSFIISPQDAVIAKEHSVKNIISFFSGIYIVMFLYNLFVFFSIREKAYTYYLFLILFSLFAVWENTGYAVQELRSFHQYPSWLSLIDVTGSTLFGTAILLFT